MSTERIAWKTNAWKDPAMVQWYARQMIDRSGGNLIKNAVEIGLIRRYAIGHHLLDVGIGTGRGSLPLLRDGMHVTGIDSSQAMLDETKRQADGLPVELLVGDVAVLPFTTPAFDTILALNVLVHFPHWREVLANWCQALLPGGRIIFDIHSRDHYDAALGEAAAEAELFTRPVAAFQATARVVELVEQATRLGLGVVDIVPYGALLGGGNTNLWWRERLEQRADWRRLMGWAAEDERLYGFSLWLEENLVWRLPSTATGRLMVVLETHADAARHNAEWLARQAALRDELAQAPTAARMLDILGVDALARAELAEHLEHARNRALLYRLLDALDARWPERDWLAAAPSQQALFSQWRRQEMADRQAMEILDRWSLPPFPAIEEKGVPLAPGFSYQLFASILQNHIKIFAAPDLP
jgi:SAM-dependent methyltransferase